jgi:hypothetical protein
VPEPPDWPLEQPAEGTVRPWYLTATGYLVVHGGRGRAGRTGDRRPMLVAARPPGAGMGASGRAPGWSSFTAAAIRPEPERCSPLTLRRLPSPDARC